MEIRLQKSTRIPCIFEPPTLIFKLPKAFLQGLANRPCHQRHTEVATNTRKGRSRRRWTKKELQELRNKCESSRESWSEIAAVG